MSENPRATMTPTKRLTPAPWNPRTISKERFENLCAALKRDPEMLWARPILATKDGVVYAGNMRLRAAIANGMTSVPAIVEAITLEQAKERALRDNGAWGEYDEQGLAEMLAKMDPAAAALVGFDEGELERLLASVGIGDVTDDDDFDPTPPEVPESRAGEVYQLGAHRLVCGDSRDPLIWAALMGGEKANTMWTDPPYGVDPFTQIGKADHGTAFQNNEPEDVAPLLEAVFAQADLYLQEGASLYIASSPGRLIRIFIERMLAVGWYHNVTIAWVKNSFSPMGHRYKPQHEAILYGWKPGATARWNQHHAETSVQDDEPKLTKLDRRALMLLVKDLRNERQTDVIREDKTHNNDLHPTMKPPRLIRTMLGNSTIRGDIVVDPFGGSGSTLVACEQMGRAARLIELEPRFADVIIRRYETLSGETVARPSR